MIIISIISHIKHSLNLRYFILIYFMSLFQNLKVIKVKFLGLLRGRSDVTLGLSRFSLGLWYTMLCELKGLFSDSFFLRFRSRGYGRVPCLLLIGKLNTLRKLINSIKSFLSLFPLL
jgi:hypothetical protein